MTNVYFVNQLEFACEMACKQHAMDFNDLYTLMPGLFFCFKKGQGHTVPSEFIDQIAAHKVPVFQLIIKYLQIMLERFERLEKEKAEEENSSI